MRGLDGLWPGDPISAVDQRRPSLAFLHSRFISFQSFYKHRIPSYCERPVTLHLSPACCSTRICEPQEGSWNPTCAQNHPSSRRRFCPHGTSRLEINMNHVIANSELRFAKRQSSRETMAPPSRACARSILLQYLVRLLRRIRANTTTKIKKKKISFFFFSFHI